MFPRMTPRVLRGLRRAVAAACANEIGSDFSHRDMECIRDDAAGWLATLPNKPVVLVLTESEVELLDLVAGNGWGDGDFADWLGNKTRAKICASAISKLRQASITFCRKIS